MHSEDDSNAHGGARPGAGRPAGSRNTLPLGAVRALKGLRLRVPKDAPEEAASLAGDALQRIVDVMNEDVPPAAAHAVLKAAALLREEICGPVTKKVEHSGAVSIAVVNPYAPTEEAPE